MQNLKEYYALTYISVVPYFFRRNQSLSLNFSRNLTSVPYSVSLIKHNECSFDENPLEPRQRFVMIQIQPRNSNQPGSKIDWYLVDQYITIIADDMKMANCLCICMILKSTHMPILQCLDLVIVKQVHISPESAIIVMYCSTKYQSVFDPGWFEFRANDALTATFGNNEILLKPLLLE